MRHFLSATLLLGCCAAVLRAQGNYEVQVYGSDLVAPKVTMVELHSNFTASGTKGTIDGVLPTNHAVHETLEADNARGRCRTEKAGMKTSEARGIRLIVSNS